MFIGGMGMMMYGLLSETGECVDRYDDGECLTRVNKPILGAGVAIGVVGIVGAMIGMFMKVHPVNESERLQLADEYNGRLRQELGLTDEIISKYRRLTAFADVGFAPLALPDGGALGLSGRFNFQLD